MEAEEHFSNGNYLLAKESYKSSIACAQSRRFVNVEALAAELAAEFFFDTGDFKSSLEHFNLAHQKYLNWGCMEKACSLFAYMNEIFGNYLSQVTSVNAGNDQQSMEGSLGNFNCN
jgi:tetratricopeptide (TPR) repeat protein